jgi:Fic family protein
MPILYLSNYIIKNKSDYYRLLQEVRTDDKWEEWILYMLDGVEKTSIETMHLVNDIAIMMKETKHTIREKLPKIYSKDLIEILFSHPYTKIEFLVEGLGLHRETASKYLKELEKLGILENIKIGRSKYFVNIKLFNRLRKGI